MRLKITISGCENIKNFNRIRNFEYDLIKSFLNKLKKNNNSCISFKYSYYIYYDKIEIIVDLYDDNLYTLFVLKDQGVYDGVGSVNRNGHNYSISMVLVSWYQG